jgi:serine/threonine-protein kinase
MLFSKKRDPLEAYFDDSFWCTGCGKGVSLEGLVPLTPVNCPHCDDVNLVPLNVGDFWLYRPLGGGGMGAVYKAVRESQPDREFAVKILPREHVENQRLIDTLVREAEIATAISGHPGMVNTIDSGIDGEPYLAMEYIKGDRLDQRISKGGTLTENETILVGLRLLSALTHIYNRGYLFRDMKPQNVMYVEGEGAVLYDYGICMTLYDSLYDDADIIEGSPIYFPPERITGDGETAASELYSLGMVMYHALTGHPYFSAKEIASLANQHIRNARVKTEGKMRKVTPELAKIVDRMIKREQHDRYQSFHEAEFYLGELLRQRLEAADGDPLVPDEGT